MKRTPIAVISAIVSLILIATFGTPSGQVKTIVNAPPVERPNDQRMAGTRELESPYGALAQQTVQSHPIPIHKIRPLDESLTKNKGGGFVPEAAPFLSYHDGPLLLGTTNIYYIWYGNWTGNTAINILTNFANNIGGSPYFAINTTYYDGSGTHVSNSVHYAGSTTDNYSLGKALSGDDIATIVNSAINSGHLPKDSNAVYFVLTSKDVSQMNSATDTFGGKYCGWHTSETLSNSPIRYSFVGNPENVTGCMQQPFTSPNNNPGADGMASVIAHELEEAVTDPDITGWFGFDAENNLWENADQCAWKFGTTYFTSNGAEANMKLGGLDYLIQQNWVNGGGCALLLATPPANDNFSSAQIISGSNGSVSGTNAGATKEAGEPNHVGNAGGRSVWYRWQAPNSGTATFSTSGSNFDTLLAVYTGASVNALTLVAANDDEPGTFGGSSIVSFSAISGTTYRIAVDGYDADTGNIILNWNLAGSAPPAPIANPATAITTTGFTSNWTAATGATGYRLDVSSASTFASFIVGYQNLDVGNVLSRNVTGLSAGTTYYYRLRAYNANGTSGNSATISLTTTSLPPPPAPVANAATSVTSSSFTANWSSATGATGYRLDVSATSSFATFVSGYQNLDVGNVLSRSVTGLSGSTTYFYRLRAYNANGTSGNSGTITVTTTVSAPPAPTANAATNVTNTGFTANWSSSTGATGYRLDVSTVNTFGSFVSGFQNLDVGNVLTRSVTGLSPGTNYFYRVRAYNVNGTSGNSGTIVLTTTSPTVQVSIQTNPAGRTFTVDGTTVSTTQTLSWTSGSSHTIGTSSPQNGATDTRFVWSSWSDSGAISHTVTPTTATTYTANFTTQFMLTTSAGAGGTVSPSSGFFNSGQSVNIAATPNTGFTFANWTGSGTGSFSGTTNPATVTMNAPITETAAFAAAATTLQFSSATYTVNEGGGFFNVTVSRSGNATSAASIVYATSNGTAKEGKDYVAAQGVLNFAAGEIIKTFPVLVIDNAFVDLARTVNLTLSNPSGASLGSTSAAILTVIDNDLVLGPNPVDQQRTFVQFHYYDFFGRYPDQSGWDFWTSQITACGTNTSCTQVARINTSGAFFLSIEFQQTGYLVERMYKTAYGNAPGNSTFGGAHQLAVPIVRFDEFLRDTQRIGQGVVVLAPGWEQLLESNKQTYANEFVRTSRFIGAFPTTMTPAALVDKLNQNAGNVLSSTERTMAINLFAGAGDSSNVTARAQAVRQVAENANLAAAEKNRAFVLAQFFGYLRRDPNSTPDSDYTGYDFWLTKLNQFNGDYIAAEMVKAFIASDEYRHRFGP